MTHPDNWHPRLLGGLLLTGWGLAFGWMLGPIEPVWGVIGTTVAVLLTVTLGNGGTDNE